MFNTNPYVKVKNANVGQAGVKTHLTALILYEYTTSSPPIGAENYAKELDHQTKRLTRTKGLERRWLYAELSVAIHRCRFSRFPSRRPHAPGHRVHFSLPPRLQVQFDPNVTSKFHACSTVIYSTEPKYISIRREFGLFGISFTFSSLKSC